MAEPKLRVAASGYGGSGYIIPTRLIDGKPQKLIGVTTALGALDKPGVLQWAVDNTAAYAAANIDALLNRSEEQAYGFLRWYWRRMKEADFDNPAIDITDYSNGVLNDLAELGTVVHEWVEADLNGWFEPELVRREQEQMVEAYLKWKSEHDVRMILTEATVVGDNYAGTLDSILEVDGVVTMVDTKTSRSTRAEHWAQLAALGAAHTLMVEVAEGEGAEYATKYGTSYWREDVVPAFTNYAILHLRPDDYDSKGNFVPSFCTLKPVSQAKVDSGYELFQASVSARVHRKALDVLDREEGKV